VGISDGSAFSARTYDLGPDLALRSITPDEATAIGAMAATMDPWARYPITAEQLGAFFARVRPDAPRFGIQVAGTLEGAFAICTDWFAGPYIQTFALAPRCQGRGIGSRVLAFIEGEARRTHQRNLWVAASDFNINAHRFYERHGFAHIAAVPALLRDDRDEFLFRKRLFG
jgi:diamine N-acetyltransferase